MIGTSFQLANEFEDAIESYHFAEITALNMSASDIHAICRQNIGELYSIQRKSDQAIDSYLKSYELHNISPILKKIMPVSGLMKEYYTNRDLRNAKKWLEAGLDLTTQLDPFDSIYVYEFEVYT
ncbi:hypothetical protein P6709_15660 [Jeotgalibacillus sp. ET6]|uniref:hypothetical protein n=1 Tax=Jeotgalibacillus sp. ET6 TaxID=3037260 RepID=UPI0024184F52|nr:hypothetical protein [Jeotgalibacillus sp. ET6]MDG5473189.1 hypothetical protein [Jeotgalibacillus sp. ET6]